VHCEAEVNARHVRVHCSLRDRETIGDLLLGVAVEQEAQDLSLARGDPQPKLRRCALRGQWVIDRGRR
jgi:hypothetical protein